MTWNQFPLSPDGTASPWSRIAAVSRIPGSMELWWIAADGSVQGAFFYDGSGWGRYELAPAGSASTNGGIAAVSRILTSMELWFVGANGSVQDYFWYEGAKWRQGLQIAPDGSASINGRIAAVSRIPTSMELWFVGANGSVQDHFWYEGANWQGFELAPDGSASTNGGIAAVSRIPASMELWFVGPNGSVQDHYWYANPLALELVPNPDHLQINPELVINGSDFTAGGRFNYTVHNWPKVQDIHNQGAVDSTGSFSRTESRDFASVGIDVVLPDVEVLAVDESTGRSITAGVSAEPFIARS